MTKEFVRLLLGGATLAAFATTASAGAQTTAAPGEPADTAAAPADQTIGANGLADIVVTAQRRSENLQRTAIPVSAVSGDQLVNAGVSDVNNISKLVPSLVVAQSSGSATNFYIRGIGTFAAAILRENPIAFNFNDVYIASPSAPVGTLYDLERVEVLKGPQGTLYGRNATGGSINIIPVKPSLAGVAGNATVEYGNYDAKKVSAAINLPLGSTVAVRVAGQAVDRDGYMSDGTDDERGAAGRVALLLKPTDRFQATITADYFRQWGKGAGSVLLPSALTPTAPDIDDRIGAGDPRSTAELRRRFPTLAGTPTGVDLPRSDGFNHGRYWGVSANLQGDMGFATLTLIGAYRNSHPNYLSYALGYNFRVNERGEQISTEARLTSNGGGPFKYVIGAYYLTEDKQGLNQFNQGPLQFSTFNARQSTESFAGFGQASYALTDALRVVGGIRHTWENKSFAVTLTQASFRIPNPTPVRVRGDLSFGNTTWKAGVEFDAGPRSLLYANVATGFKSGGFVYAAVNNTYQPEKLTAYTIGSKNRFFDNRLQANLEVFYWDYQNQQVNYVGPVQLVPGVYSAGGTTTNAGQARLYGADLELRFQASPRDIVGAEVQYLHSEYRQLNYLQLSATGAAPRTACIVSPNSSLPITAPARLFNVDCAGRPAINAPRWSVNLAYQHRFPIGDYNLLADVHSRIESGRYLSIEYLPEERQGSYTTTDLMLTLEAPDARWAVSAFVNNVEDDTVLSSSAGLRPFLNTAYAVLRPPRTYGVRARLKF